MAASVCMDGVIKGKHKLCHSKNELAPWIALDYGENTLVAVEKVLLYNRWDNSFGRTKNVQIQISNELPTDGKTMFSGGEALGTFKGPATKGQINEIESGPGWEKKTGRYLIIQMDMGKAAPLNLHEVEAVCISYTLKGRCSLCFTSPLISLPPAPIFANSASRILALSSCSVVVRPSVDKRDIPPYLHYMTF